MTYLELAKKVLAEAHRLMWVDDIWTFAKKKGYDKELPNVFSNEEDNINMLDSVLFQHIGDEDEIGLLKEHGLYFLTTFDKLPLLVEDALDGHIVRTFKEVQESKKPKKFSPSKRGFDGMIFFWSIPVGFPISLYVMMTIQGSFHPGPILILGTPGMMLLFFMPLGLFHLWSTNCDVTIYPDRIEFYRIFVPKMLMQSVPIKDLKSISVKGIGLESQVKSDFKYIDISFQKGKQVIKQRVRSHAYINPPDYYDPFQIRVHDHESFTSLRSFLKEICTFQGIDYREE